jgi:exodeoxyribonuclease VII large subunit
LKTYSLYELNEFLRRVVALNFSESVWVTAEMGQINLSRGHYYIRLLEKEDGDDVVAELSAVLWASDYKRLKRTLGNSLESVFVEGMEVRLKGRLDFHERYGLKMIVEEIDPTYTIGKLEIQRRALIAELQNEDLLRLNVSLKTPSVWQRIAVISSETAAGWADFQNHILENAYAYQFDIQLFPSAMQGQFVEREMLKQLELIRLNEDRFDCVAIMRGGGAKLDLAAFDNPSVCRAVARFPLPVLTGIGHEVDYTVLDMVAHTALKTPTAVADFLIERHLQFESTLMEMGHFLKNHVQNTFYTEGGNLARIENYLQFQTAYYLKNQAQKLDYWANDLPKLVTQTLKFENIKLSKSSDIINLMSVEATLKRGFSITRKNGKIVSSMDDVQKGEEIETELSDGTIMSQITE